ncbi:hypothetical protein MASR1M36_08710 [Candidatus Cloacimonadaceae bacterium]
MKKQQLKPTPKTPELASWEEVNASLKRLGELEVSKRELENKKTELISQITAKFDADAAPLLLEMEQLNGSILGFAEAHKDEFVRERTKELSHGTISMRVSTAVKIISKAICLKALKGLGMLDFILVKEEPNKEMLKSLDDIQLAKVACEKKVVDNITITPKIEEITPLPQSGSGILPDANKTDIPINQ